MAVTLMEKAGPAFRHVKTVDFQAAPALDRILLDCETAVYGTSREPSQPFIDAISTDSITHQPASKMVYTLGPASYFLPVVVNITKDEGSVWKQRPEKTECAALHPATVEPVNLAQPPIREHNE
jgi:hypothetical protein